MLATTYSSPCGVPSVVEGLTSVFGMRTGGPLPPKHQLRELDYLKSHMNWLFECRKIDPSKEQSEIDGSTGSRTPDLC